MWRSYYISLWMEFQEPTEVGWYERHLLVPKTLSDEYVK